MTNILVISDNNMFTQTIYGVEYTFEYGMDKIASAEWLELDGTGISVAYECDGIICNSYEKNTDTGDGYIIGYYKDSYYDNSNNSISTEDAEMLEAEANGL